MSVLKSVVVYSAAGIYVTHVATVLYYKCSAQDGLSVYMIPKQNMATAHDMSVLARFNDLSSARTTILPMV